MTDLLVTTLDDGVATLTLNRPKAINSLNLEMLQAASEILTSWAHDDSVREGVLRGEGARGFSAGADVRELLQAISGNGSWLRFLEVEYLLDLIVAQFPKHVTAHLNGITMGGGLGLTVNADRRIVDSSTLMAMPETKIGFFPDAGVMYWLARAGALGTHMAGATLCASTGPTSRPTAICPLRCRRPPGSRSATPGTTRSRSHTGSRSTPTRPPSRRVVSCGLAHRSRFTSRCGRCDGPPPLT